MTLLSISADSHIVEPGDCYIDRIDPRFRDRAPVGVTDDTVGAMMDIDRGRSRVALGMLSAAGRPADLLNLSHYVGWEELYPGGWDPKARLLEEDRDGVSAEVLYPSIGMLLCNHPDADYKKACFDAYNQWLGEFVTEAPDRLIGLGQTALRSPAEGIEDLQRMKALGLAGVMIPGYASCWEEGDYDDPRWDPFWRAAIELKMVPSFHILTSGNDVPGSAWQFRGPKMNSFLGIIRGCQDLIGTFVFGGVFERNPDLKVVCVEADAGWLPHWMRRADHAMVRHHSWLTAASLSRLPSDYVRDNVYVTFQDDWVAFQTVDLVEHRRLMWANDHPHSDSTFPESQRLLAEHTAHLSDDVRDDIIWRNCAALYELKVPTAASA
jgi:predicted TIM-barrel fold metal-dependent hydrolase